MDGKNCYKDIAYYKEIARIKKRVLDSTKNTNNMEEHILNIFNENSSDANNGQMSVVTEDSYGDVAEEITQHVFEFAEWLMCDNDDFSMYSQKGEYIQLSTGSLCQMDYIYQYWLNNVYNVK